jgi:hypothetical protein
VNLRASLDTEARGKLVASGSDRTAVARWSKSVVRHHTD